MSKTVSIEEFGKTILETTKPYLKKREYGGLELGGYSELFGSEFPKPFNETEEKVLWHIYFHDITGSTHLISAQINKIDGTYSIKGGEFHQVVDLPEEAMQNLKIAIESIPEYRWEELMSFAQERKRNGIPLEQALSDLREEAEKRKRKQAGPTEEEFEWYDNYCEQLYEDKTN